MRKYHLLQTTETSLANAVAYAAMASIILMGWTATPDAQAAEAPDARGITSYWTTGAKEGIGTSATSDSKIWYTLHRGILGEVYYPQVDTPNVQDLQFIVTDGQSFVDLERDATTHSVILPDPQALTYRQVNTKAGQYRITKTYVTDVRRPTLLIETRFQALSGGPYHLYVLYNPSLANSGMGDAGASSGSMLVANDGNIASALASSSGFVKMSSGYSGTPSDGYQDLIAHHILANQYDSASTPGNIVQIGEISAGSDTTFTLALSFGANRDAAANNAQQSLTTSFVQQRETYEQGWHEYLAHLKVPHSVIGSELLRAQYNVALMTLKAHEDKTVSGAHVASLSIPWGDTVVADDCCAAGYHHVWARDLYQVATAQLAAGDADSANRSLDFLLDKQQIKAATNDGGGLDEGAFPRFSAVDGQTDRGCCEQMDQDAFPIILAWQLGRTDAQTWQKLRLTADHVMSKGPQTRAERWEEVDGWSPSTIAAEIAGLVCAADIAQENGDAERSGHYLAKADEWQSQLQTWTFTQKGTFGDGHYYERIDRNHNPDDLDTLHFLGPAQGEDFWEKDVVDASFLELVRLGVKTPDDPQIAQSLAVVDQALKASTPSGDMFHRYNHDSYGENENSGEGWKDNAYGYKGRLWPILTGERGEYELANGRPATTFLQTMANAANEGHMIPEQVWDEPDKFGFVFGKGTGSATPLAWSMAEFVRLALSIDAGKPVETPAIVAQRYAK
jgi:glucoamylase